MKIVVNRGLCDGNGNCVREAPGLFALDEDDMVQVLKESVGEADRAAAEAAVAACPKNALKLAE